MALTKKEIKHSLSIQQKIRKASFVDIETPVNEKFKYAIVSRLFSKLSKLFVLFKSLIIKEYQRIKLWALEYDWKVIKDDMFVWLVEILLEGVTANFATHFILGMDFNIWTVFAHGIVIKQGLSIYWRLKKDGSTTTIPKKNN